MAITVRLSRGNRIAPIIAEQEDLNTAPRILKRGSTYYAFMGWHNDVADYMPEMPWEFVEEKEKKVQTTLDKARLDDQDGNLVAIVKYDSSAGAARMLVYRGKCYQFHNYQSLAHIPTYRECTWDVLPDTAKVEDEG